MRNRILVLALVALALGAGFYAWSRRGARPSADDLSVAPDDPARPPAPIADAAMGGSDLARGPDRPAPTPKAPERAPASTVVRTGDVTVTFAPPAGVEMPTGFRLDAEPIGFVSHVKRLALEQPDHTWRYAELPVGRWRIRAYVLGFMDVAKDVEVREGEEATVSLELERGAAVAWKVALLSGEAPESVRVVLLDGRGVPRTASYETSASTIHAAPDAVPALPASGRVVGLKPGRYRLRATSPAGESDEKAFEVAVGETATVELTLRR